MYTREITEASKSALLELGLEMKRYRNDIVLSGGWAPYFITYGYFEHCGSIGIDLVLRTKIMKKYDTIKNSILRLGYVEENPFRFSRTVKSPIDEKDYTVHIDFLCDKEGKKYVNLKSVQEDLQAFSFEGLNIAFEFNFEQEIKTVLPNNGEAKTQSAFSEHRTEKQKRILQRPAGIRKKQKHQADDRASPQRVQIPEETPQKVTTKIKTVVTHRARLRVYHQT